jgi:hypothetical protein
MKIKMKKSCMLGLGIAWLLMSTCVLGASTDTSSPTSSDATATNMVVDFTTTSVDASIRPGESGIINLVIKNSGGQKAENIQVWLQSSASVSADKRFYVGTMSAGESKTIPVIYLIPATAKTGLTAIQVKINFDGYKSDGTIDNNQLTTWEIPLSVLGNPQFQIIAGKTTYYRDTLDVLDLEIVAKDGVKDVETALSSGCISIIGSPGKYVGAIGSDQPSELTYSIKPTKSGTCPVSLYISYTDDSGNQVSSNQTVGLNVEDAGVDFKIVKVSYTPTAPGQQSNMTILLRNVGDADADKVTAQLAMADPFIPVDTTEFYMPKVSAGQEFEAKYGFMVSWTADTVPESLPLEISYKVGGTSYNVTKDIGVDITGKVVLKVINVESGSGSVRIDLANIGSRTAEGIQATLVTQESAVSQQNTPGSRPASNATQTSKRQLSYKSDIKASKQSTFTYETSATGPATLEIEYTGINNERITQIVNLTLGTTQAQAGNIGTGATGAGTGYTTYLIAAAVLIIAFVAYRRLRRKK